MRPALPEPPEDQEPRRHRLALIVSVATVLSCLLVAFGLFAMTAGLVGYRWPPLRLFLIETAVNRMQTRTPSPANAHVVASSTARPTITLAPLAPATATATPLTSVAAPVGSITTPAATSTPILSITRSVDVSTTAGISVTTQDTQRQLRIFNQLWDTVERNYIYPDFNGFDWQAARISTTQAITSGIDNEQFYDLMRSLIDDLNDNHSTFLSPDEVRQEQQDYAGSSQYTGVGVISDLNTQKQYAYVLQVLPGSPAQAAGIQAHDHILSIAGQPAVDAQGKSNMTLLRGPAGTSVSLTVSAPGGEPRDLLLSRAILSTTSPVESRILSGTRRIGYLLIPTLFEDDEAQKVRVALRALTRGGALDGLIIDMRINGGGAYPVLVSTLAFFTHGVAGTLVDRDGVRETVNIHTESIGNSQTTPLMVLIGPDTESYAEVFAGILHASGRAKLVGQNSAGNIETLRSHEFEDGSLVWLAEETFHLPNGDNWEGKGLAPEIVIDRAWDEYTTANDPAIQAAMDSLTSRQK